MSHIKRRSTRKARGFSMLFIATVCVAAMMGLVACGVGGGSVQEGIKLTLEFPVFEGAEAITMLKATLEKADGTGTLSRTLNKTAADFANSHNGDNIKITTLDFGSVPVGQYLLILTFYRGATIAALWIESVTVQPGEMTDKWQDYDGGTYSIRRFMKEEFPSTAVAASFWLKNVGGSYVPLSQIDPMPVTWEIDKSRVDLSGEVKLEIHLYGGPGTSLIAVTLDGNDKLSLFSTTNGSSAIPVYTGTLNILNVNTISVVVQAPDRKTTQIYTISQSP